VFPAALPSAIVGLRISLALSFVLAFATEAIGASRDGLGHLIQESYANQLYDPMYAGIFTFALLGLAADVILRLAARRFTRGRRLEAVGVG
jgi:ABC-type nitrate/sulfonate/bicarbonate transport system permease component